MQLQMIFLQWLSNSTNNFLSVSKLLSRITILGGQQGFSCVSHVTHKLGTISSFWGTYTSEERESTLLLRYLILPRNREVVFAWAAQISFCFSRSSCSFKRFEFDLAGTMVAKMWNTVFSFSRVSFSSLRLLHCQSAQACNQSAFSSLFCRFFFKAPKSASYAWESSANSALESLFHQETSSSLHLLTFSATLLLQFEGTRPTERAEETFNSQE